MNAKTYVFGRWKLFFWKMKTIFWLNKRKSFSRLKMLIVRKRENWKCSQTLKKLRFESNWSANWGLEIMHIAYMNLFPNALFNLFHAIFWQVHPHLISPRIKVKGWKGIQENFHRKIPSPLPHLFFISLSYTSYNKIRK